MTDRPQRQYEWHATVAVCWLVAGLAVLSVLGIGPGPGTPTAAGANLVIHLGILALIVIAYFRLPILLDGREGMRPFTLLSLTVGAAASVFVILGNLAGA